MAGPLEDADRVIGNVGSPRGVRRHPMRVTRARGALFTNSADVNAFDSQIKVLDADPTQSYPC